MVLIPTIGLEIHAELKTRSKMFCSSKNDPFAAAPNINICPVCMAHPGTLPVINKEAVRHVLRVGIAVGGTLADYTEFDRKNYFYPDLPKGYQLSQFEFPLVSRGVLRDVVLTRIHLEEDTAASTHDDVGGDTRIDYNRAGVPLMELVTEPVIHSAKQAGDFGRELQLLLRYLEASDADMEKGHMRLEANISLAPEGAPLGTKVEVKNIASFRAMERAIEYEIQRQTALIEAGKAVVQETRGWDDAKQATFSQRIKEGSADYRYFPDPDLPSLKLSEIEDFSIDTLKKTLPELPAARRQRYIVAGVKEADAIQFASYPQLGAFFDTVVAQKIGNQLFVQTTANYIANDLVSELRGMGGRDTDFKSEISISAANFSSLMMLVVDGKISSRSTKDLLAEMLTSDFDPVIQATERGLIIDSSGTSLETMIDTIIAENPTVVADYKAGKEAAIQFLVGQGMKRLKGAANPTQLKEALVEKMAKSL